MKTESIIFRASPRIAALLRENAAHQGRTMTDLITSSLESYLCLIPEKVYPDPPTVRPLPIYFMLGNPDGHFYNVGVGERTVSGLFEGTARDFSGEWHTLTGIEWEVSIGSFLSFAYQLGLVDDYDTNDGTVSIGERDYNARQWAADWLQENNATELFYKVLTAAYRAEFLNDLNTIAYRLTEFHGNPARLWDADLKTAALQLADLFRACEGWPIQGI